MLYLGLFESTLKMSLLQCSVSITIITVSSSIIIIIHIMIMMIVIVLIISNIISISKSSANHDLQFDLQLANHDLQVANQLQIVICRLQISCKSEVWVVSGHRCCYIWDYSRAP